MLHDLPIVLNRINRTDDDLYVVIIHELFGESRRLHDLHYDSLLSAIRAACTKQENYGKAFKVIGVMQDLDLRNYIHVIIKEEKQNDI